MTDTQHAVRSDLTAGDAVVDGLFSGALAGILMAIFAAAVWLLLDPGGGELFGNFMAERGLSLVNTLLLHMAVSSVYGLVFSLGYNLFARASRSVPSLWPSVMAGVVYGAMLLGLAHLVILPAGASPLQLSLVLSIPAHLIYGAVLGALVHRSRYIPFYSSRSTRTN